MTPAAGANYTLAVPGQWEMRVLSVLFTFVADANAANRVVTLDHVSPDGKVFASSGASAVITATTTQAYIGQIDRTNSEWNANTPIWFPIADFWVKPAYSARITVANIQATDQLSAIRLIVERFETGPAGYPQGARLSRRRR